MQFYTTHRISERRSKTPEGFLLIQGTPLARTGTMEYGPEELPPMFKDDAGPIQITRTPEEVFAPSSLASFAAKPLVYEHPSEDVTPKNFRGLLHGTILNPRQGEGAEADLVLGDIVVYEPELIAELEKGEEPEVSVGYDADYERTGPNKGTQKNIIVNHVAWVKQGRCGPRCKIGDEQSTEKSLMSYLTDKLRAAFKAKDEAALDAIEAEIKKEKPELVGEKDEERGDTHVHVHLGSGTGKSPMGTGEGSEDDEGTEMAEGGTTEERLARVESLVEAIAEALDVGGEDRKWIKDRREKDKRAKDKREKDKREDKSDDESEEEEKEKEKKEKDKKSKDDETIEGKLEMEAPPGTEDKARKARDSSYLTDAWQQHVAWAEIIVPGARMPTFDRAARPATTLDMLCGARIELLQHAYNDQKTRAVIDQINGGRVLDFKRLTCDAARTMIAAVATTIGQANNRGLGFGTYVNKQGNGGGLGVKGKITSIADLNRLAVEMRKK